MRLRLHSLPTESDASNGSEWAAPRHLSAALAPQPGCLLGYMGPTGNLPITAAEAATTVEANSGHPWTLTRASPPGFLADSSSNRCRQIVSVVSIKFVFTGIAVHKSLYPNTTPMQVAGRAVILLSIRAHIKTPATFHGCTEIRISHRNTCSSSFYIRDR